VKTTPSIAYCIHSLNLSGGIERVLSIKANYLADVLGYDVSIVTARMKGRKPFFELSERIHLYDLDANDRIFLGKYTRRLDNLLGKIRPDITVSVCGNEVFALPKCKDGSVKMGEFHFSHEKYQVKYGTNPFGRIYASFRTRRLEKAVRRLSRLVVLTKEDQQDWLKVMPDVAQIYNPLSFTSESASPLTRKRCIAAGRLEPQKNLQDMILAWKDVAPAHPDWTLDIYGNGRQREQLESLIKQEGLQGKVRLMGATKAMRDELLDSSCLVLSSRYEGFPMILIEGLSCGLPIVSYRCPKGPSEVVSSGRNGYLVDMGDRKGLADGLCKVIENEDMRKGFGAESKALSVKFSLDSVMQEWDRLFRSLL